MQPVIVDKHGAHRFKSNAVVRYLLDNGGIDLNRIAIAYQNGDGFPAEDMRQFMQLIGYSVSGWANLTDYRSEGDPIFAEQDPAEDAAKPGNSDGECIARALEISMKAWRNTDMSAEAAAQPAIGDIDRILSGSPTGKRLAG